MADAILRHRDSQEGSFAFVFKSQHFPDEIVAARRGSPLLVGVKTDRKLKVDFVDVELPTADTTEKRESSFFAFLGYESVSADTDSAYWSSSLQ